MKKQTLIFWLALVIPTILVVGCASTKSVEVLGNRLGANELDLQMTRQKLAKVEGIQIGLGERIEKVEKTDIALKIELGATKKDLTNVTQRVEGIEVDLGATRTQIQGLTAKTDGIEKGLGIAKKEFKDIQSYIPVFRKIIAEREAKHGYKADAVEKIVVCIVGSFESGQSKLNKDIEAGLEKALAKFKEKNCEVVGIHGFADTVGFKGKTPQESEGLNKELSFGRAKVVQAWYKGKNIDVPDDKVLGLGEVINFGTEKDNRAVVIFGLPKPPAPAASPAKTPSTKP